MICVSYAGYEPNSRKLLHLWNYPRATPLSNSNTPIRSPSCTTMRYPMLSICGLNISCLMHRPLLFDKRDYECIVRISPRHMTDTPLILGCFRGRYIFHLSACLFADVYLTHISQAPLSRQVSNARLAIGVERNLCMFLVHRCGGLTINCEPLDENGCMMVLGFQRIDSRCL